MNECPVFSFHSSLQTDWGMHQEMNSYFYYDQQLNWSQSCQCAWTCPNFDSFLLDARFPYWALPIWGLTRSLACSTSCWRFLPLPLGCSSLRDFCPSRGSCVLVWQSQWPGFCTVRRVWCSPTWVHLSRCILQLIYFGKCSFLARCTW